MTSRIWCIRFYVIIPAYCYTFLLITSYWSLLLIDTFVLIISYLYILIDTFILILSYWYFRIDTFVLIFSYSISSFSIASYTIPGITGIYLLIWCLCWCLHINIPILISSHSIHSNYKQLITVRNLSFKRWQSFHSSKRTRF